MILILISKIIFEIKNEVTIRIEEKVKQCGTIGFYKKVRYLREPRDFTEQIVVLKKNCVIKIK